MDSLATRLIWRLVMIKLFNCINQSFSLHLRWRETYHFWIQWSIVVFKQLQNYHNNLIKKHFKLILWSSKFQSYGFLSQMKGMYIYQSNPVNTIGVFEGINFMNSTIFRKLRNLFYQKFDLL